MGSDTLNDCLNYLNKLMNLPKLYKEKNNKYLKINKNKFIS